MFASYVTLFVFLLESFVHKFNMYDFVDSLSNICVWVLDLTCSCTLPLQFAGRGPVVIVVQVYQNIFFLKTILSPALNANTADHPFDCTCQIKGMVVCI